MNEVVKNLNIIKYFRKKSAFDKSAFQVFAGSETLIFFATIEPAFF